MRSAADGDSPRKVAVKRGVDVPADFGWQELEALRERQVQTLRSIVGVFDSLGLDYFLAYGAVIGMARHDGHAIPWDDDIDLIMPWEAYEMGVAALSRDPAFDVLEFTKDGDFRVMPAKVALRVIVDRFDGDDRRRNYIDIFAMDVKPRNGIAAFVRRKMLSFFGNVVLFRTGNLRGWRKWCFAVLSALLPCDIRSVKRMLVRYSRTRVPFGKWRRDTIVGEAFSAYGDRVYMPWNVYVDGNGKRRVEVFEGVRVAVPCDMDAYLTHIYGDWRKMPPVEERRPRHPVVGAWFYSEWRERNRK